MRPTLEEIATLGREMRVAQKQYFRSNHCSASLAESKRLERAFDLACSAALAPTGLFDQKEAETP